MSFFSRLMSGVSRKDSAVGPMISLRKLGKPVWSPRRYSSFSKEGYTQNVVAFRSIRMTAEAVASIPILAFEGDNELTEHPMLNLLRNPNPWQSGAELVDTIIAHYRIAGEGFMEGVALDGEMRELYALRPDRMTPIAGPRGYPSGWRYKVGEGQGHLFEMEDTKQWPVMHLRDFNPLDDWRGLSPVEAAAFSIDVHNEAGAFNKSLLQNSAAPSGALVFNNGDDGANLSDDQFSKLKSEIEDKYSGAKNAGRPMLLEGGLTWQAMGTSPREMELVEGKREAAREIALAFGVPPLLLGLPGDNTFANYKEANVAFYRQTVLPLACKFLESVSNFVQPTYEGLVLKPDMDAIPALSVERDAVWDRVNKSDHLTTDEKRKATGYGHYAPDEGKPGGSILVNGSQMPLEESGFMPGGGEPED